MLYYIYELNMKMSHKSWRMMKGYSCWSATNIKCLKDWSLSRENIDTKNKIHSYALFAVKIEEFYEKHGGYTLIMARFVPIVRTFAPFAAGMGTMTYKKFITYCIAGAVLWVTSITSLGYALGQNPWVKDHFETVVFGIIGISILPMVYQFIKHKWLQPKS